ncbi:Zn-dependent protease with chaperone function [Actinokineospora baliensis]|uniref:M48 family metallopeptidase n=1 Tax=Actinokineospora baliensis TaxID=547056 RepID=UPI001957741E|nr:M48 family metallopeptidase [Actinokineospora baliensis]MBM7772165.1 Zn-dependent protease with chaperone function [Actinokineospora baliensis]
MSESDLPAKPGADTATRTAGLLAVLSYLVTAGVMAFCGWLAYVASTLEGFDKYALYGFALVLFGMALATGPRLGLLYAEHNVVQRESAPALYALADQIADELGTRRVWRFEVSAEFNANYRMIWFRRRPVITLGYPLWNLLTAQERVALLAHELAHGANGDPRRSALIGPSLDGLVQGADQLSIPLDDTDSEFMVVLAILWHPIRWLLTFPMLALMAAQDRLLLRSSRRAELYADHLAARVAGAAALVSLLRKTHLGDRAVDDLLAAVRREDDDVWAAQLVCLEGLDEVVIGDEDSTDSTHPSTRERIDAVAGREYGPAVVEGEDELDGELAEQLPAVLTELRDAA